MTTALHALRFDAIRPMAARFALVLSCALVLVAASAASAFGAAAPNVVTARYAGGITGLNKPSALVYQNNQLFVVDAGNNRVVRYNLSGQTTFGGPVTATNPLAWGSFGTGTSNFKNPQGIAISHQGWVSVADTGNNRVIQFNTNGGFRRQWGGLGTGTGNSQFNAPHAIAQSPLSNLLYVLDSGNSRVQYFNPGGNYQGQFNGQTLGLISANAAGLAVGTDGRIVVTDTGNNRVLEFSASGVPIRQYGSSGTELGQFTSPRDTDYGPTPYSVVLDSGATPSRIQAYDMSGPAPRTINSFTGATQAVGLDPLPAEPNVTNPNGVQYLAVGNPDQGQGGLIIVADTDKNRIQFLWLDYSYVEPGGGGPDPIDYDLEPISYDGLPCTTCHQYDTRVEHNIKTGDACLSCHEVYGRSGQIGFVELHNRIETELGEGGFDDLGSCGANSNQCHSIAAGVEDGFEPGERANQVLDGPKIQAAHVNRTASTPEGGGWEPTTTTTCSGAPGTCHSFGANPADPATPDASDLWFGSMDRASAHADYYRYQKDQLAGGGSIAGLAAGASVTDTGTVDITAFVNGCQLCHQPDFTQSYGKLNYDYAFDNNLPFSCESCHVPSGVHGSYSGRPECARTEHWNGISEIHPEDTVSQMGITSIAAFGAEEEVVESAQVSDYVQQLIEFTIGSGDDADSSGEFADKSIDPIELTGASSLPQSAVPASSSIPLSRLLNQ